MSKRSRTIQRSWLIAISLLIILFSTAVYFTSRPKKSVELVPPSAPFVSIGLDVSHHQGKIDWDQVIESTDSLLSFVYFKSTEGTRFIDPSAHSNQQALHRREIPNGAYHFFSPHQDAIAQAEHFLNNYNPTFSSLPPVLDVETEGASDQNLIGKMKLWLDHVEGELGVRPIIYTNYHFYNTKFEATLKDEKFWIAHYTSNSNHLNKDNIIHWQYSEFGKVDGINGFVDLNYSKVLIPVRPNDLTISSARD